MKVHHIDDTVKDLDDGLWPSVKAVRERLAFFPVNVQPLFHFLDVTTATRINGASVVDELKLFAKKILSDAKSPAPPPLFTLAIDRKADRVVGMALIAGAAGTDSACGGPATSKTTAAKSDDASATKLSVCEFVVRMIYVRMMLRLCNDDQNTFDKHVQVVSRNFTECTATIRIKTSLYVDNAERYSPVWEAVIRAPLFGLQFDNYWVRHDLKAIYERNRASFHDVVFEMRKLPTKKKTTGNSAPLSPASSLVEPLEDDKIEMTGQILLRNTSASFFPSDTLMTVHSSLAEYVWSSNDECSYPIVATRADSAVRRTQVYDNLAEATGGPGPLIYSINSSVNRTDEVYFDFFTTAGKKVSQSGGGGVLPVRDVLFAVDAARGLRVDKMYSDVEVVPNSRV